RAGTPNLPPRRLVERRDRRSARRADVDNELLAFDERRRRGPEEILPHVVIRAQIHLPDRLSRCELETMELPFGSHREHAIAVDHRTGPRTVVVPVPVLERGGIAKAPAALPRFRMETLDDLLVRDPVQEHQ